MFLIKKMIFKFMELGLGLRTCFSLETKNPIFINFRLTEEEIKRVAQNLPEGYRLCPIRFTEDEEVASYWISYNIYELKYPKPELASIRKSRLEINTFVEDSQGRKGVFVFCDSPFVSREIKRTFLGMVCDFAEWLVTKIYGVGQLVEFEFSLTEKLKVSLTADGHSVRIDSQVDSNPGVKLSADYLKFNDISFFNQGKTCDYVNVNSAFYDAKFINLKAPHSVAECEGPYFKRSPDLILVHYGEISYLVNSMNLCQSPGGLSG